MEILSIYACSVIAAVLKTQSFTKAGETLNLTPSAVSHTIKKIENAVGFPLFYRYKNGVFMTESGKALMPYVESLLKTSRVLDEEIINICNKESGIVKVGTFYSATTYWMPEILKAFHAKHPDITVQLYQSGDSQIIEWINNLDIDLAILSSDTFDASIPFTPLYKSPLVCLTPADYKPMDGERVTPADLSSTQLILQYEGFDTEITCYLKTNNISAPTNIWVESDDAGFALVKAGLGCYLSPLMAVGDNVHHLNIYPLYPPAYRSIGILPVSPKHVSTAAKGFHEHIIDWVAALKKAESK